MVSRSSAMEVSRSEVPRPGRPVRVVMPATAIRPHQSELLLFGHHYRTSRLAQAVASATVTALPRPQASRSGALPDLSSPRIPVG